MVWELATGKLLHTLRGHTNNVQSVIVSPDSNYVISGSLDKTIKIWNLAKGELFQTLEGHKQMIFSVALSSDSQYIISGSMDKTLKVWKSEFGIKKEGKKLEKVKKERLEREAVGKIKEMMEVSSRIKLDIIGIALKMNKDTFISKIFE